MRARDHFILYTGIAAIVALSAVPTAKAQPCQPYDAAIKNLAEAGWTVLPDIEVPGGYEVDRLIVGAYEGFAYAMPMVDGCVIPTQPIPLGHVKDKGEPA